MMTERQTEELLKQCMSMNLLTYFMYILPIAEKSGRYNTVN